MCVATLPGARAVSPPPDGGYPGGNTAEGTDALLSLSSGTSNTAIGADALANNVSGNDNTAVGFQALLLATGNHNTAVGSEALFFDTSGHDNTATGFQALLNNTTGIENVASGAFALIRTRPATLILQPALEHFRPILVATLTRLLGRQRFLITPAVSTIRLTVLTRSFSIQPATPTPPSA